MELKSLVEMTENEFHRLKLLMLDQFGIEIKDEKKLLVENRLAKIITQRGFTNYTKYLDYLGKNRLIALEELGKNLTTNHTYFNREPEHFDLLSEKILPWHDCHFPGEEIRIWSAGCSTGEEAYSIGLKLYEIQKHQKAHILATDISTHVLEIAEKGVYSEEDIKHLPKGWLEIGFDQIAQETYRIKDQFRNMVQFRYLNFKEDHFLFKKKFHVIFCRNVLIYIHDQEKERLMNQFYDATEEGGYLILSHTESIPKNLTKYHFVEPSVYRK